MSAGALLFLTSPYGIGPSSSLISLFALQFDAASWAIIPLIANAMRLQYVPESPALTGRAHSSRLLHPLSFPLLRVFQAQLHSSRLCLLLLFQAQAQASLLR